MCAGIILFMPNEFILIIHFFEGAIMSRQKRWEDYSEQDILHANIEKYDNDAIIKFYEDLEEPKYLYAEYSVIFKAVLDMLALSNDRVLRAADMCGGAGKAAFVLKECKPDCTVNLVDVSDKMLEIAEKKAEKLGVSGITLTKDDAFNFLERDAEYDLIVFSSAIHHFKDPVNLLNLASTRLAENGIIITIADPTIITKTRRYKFFEFLASNSEGKKQKLKACFSSGRNKGLTNGLDFDLAEYQTYTGIDDIQLRQDLFDIGLNPLIHLRYPAGEPYMTKIMPYLGLCWAFSMVISKSKVDEFEAHKDTLKGEILSNMPFRFKFMF